MTLPPDSAHLTDEELAAYVDRGLDGADRTRMERHLVDCDDCRAVVAAAGRALEAPLPNRRRRVVWIGGAALAAAAAITLAVIPRGPEPFGAGADGARSSPGQGEDGARFAARGPAGGAVVLPDTLAFAWEDQGDGTVYQLTISDERGAVAWTERTEDTSVALPAAVGVTLVPGQAYYWRVEALFSDLRTATTDSRLFIVGAR